MPRSEVVYTAFLSSPSGLSNDRIAVVEAVREVNMLARDYGYRIDLVRWEVDVIPERGPDAQAVINQQCSSYDIFIGLIGSRFGTETPRYGSGTEEEYAEAVKKHKETNGDVAVLFYRCKTPIDPFTIDAEQLANVHKFIHSIRNDGQIVQDYSTPEELSALIRIALPRVITSRQSHASCTTPPRHPARKEGDHAFPSLGSDASGLTQPSMSDEELEQNELGLLDLLVASDESFTEVVSITDSIGQITGELAIKVNDIAAQINVSRSGIPAIDARRSMRLVDTVAAHLDAYAVTLREKTSMLSEAVEVGVNLMIELFSKSAEARVPLGTLQQRAAAVETLSTTVKSFDPAMEAMSAFRLSLDSAPPLTSRFNAARRAAKKAISYLINELGRQKQMISLCVDATSNGVTIEDVFGTAASRRGETGDAIP